MKYASIDVGLKRIGVAISMDSKVIIPLEAILRKNRNQAATDVVKRLKEWEIEHLVVGIPHDGSSFEEMQRRITHFVALLHLDIPVSYQDEQGSSMEASQMIQGNFRDKRDGKLDSIAAQIILERYLQRIKGS